MAAYDCSVSDLKATLHVTVWPKGKYTPGQIELWTDRGKSVVLTQPEAEEWIARLQAAFAKVDSQ